MFERETAREKNLEKAAKEARQKARKEAGKTGEAEKVLTEENLEQASDSDHTIPLPDIYGLVTSSLLWSSHIDDNNTAPGYNFDQAKSAILGS